MKLSNSTINALGRLITGNSELTPYLSGPALVSFFNDFGSQAVYASGFPSRWKFAEQEVMQFNGTDKLSEIVEATVDPRRFLHTDLNAEAAVEFLNKYLQYDNYELIKNGLRYKVVSRVESETIDRSHNSQSYTDIFTNKISNDFIVEQSEKCQEKIYKKDYDGAITNARSMVEAVFIEVVKQNIDPEYEYDGDLVKLYKQIKTLLPHDPSQVDLNDSIKQILSGLNSIVCGISSISNKMGDRHARKYVPQRHHALVMCNTAHALCGFIIGSLKYQADMKKNNVKENLAQAN